MQQSRKVLRHTARCWKLNPKEQELLFSSIDENNLVESIKSLTPQSAKHLTRQEFLRVRAVALIYLLRQEPASTETALQSLSDIRLETIEKKHVRLMSQLDVFFFLFKKLVRSANTIH